MHGRRFGALAGAMLATLAMLAIPGDRAEAKIPADFYGVVAQGALLETDYALMEEGGVGSLRFPIEWSQVEPQPGVYDFARTDAIVAGAVARGIEPLPFVWASPEWLTGNKAIPPLGSSAEKRTWQDFLAVLVERYRGSIDRWQLWNEANFKVYWKPKPDPEGYAELVRISAKSIRAGDPDAEIILGGVAPVKRGMLPWEFLEGVYDVKGIERSFETIAVHPYFPELSGVEFQIRQALDEVDAAGDRRAKLRITELGWASEGPAADPMTKGRKGQAKILTESYRFLEKRRKRFRLTGIDWHSFQDVGTDEGEPVCSFCPGSGLFTVEREPKPAWDAFRRFARD